MAKTGRPRKNSVEAFAAAIDACVEAFEQSDDAIDLTDAALAKRLNISIDRLDRYYMGEPDAAIARTRAADSSTDSDKDSGDNTESNQTERTYNGELKRLIAYRSAQCVSHIARGGQVTGWIFLSKQKRWGGFSDTQRAETLTKSEVTVTLKGADGKQLL